MTRRKRGSKINFEWDSQKAQQNARKHRVSFEEAATIFGDESALYFEDPDHSIDEDRYIIIGLSSNGRLLMAAYTERNNSVRLISARRVTQSEREFYNERKR